MPEDVMNQATSKGNAKTLLSSANFGCRDALSGSTDERVIQMLKELKRQKSEVQISTVTHLVHGSWMMKRVAPNVEFRDPQIHLQTDRKSLNDRTKIKAALVCLDRLRD